MSKAPDKQNHNPAFIGYPKSTIVLATLLLGALYTIATADKTSKQIQVVCAIIAAIAVMVIISSFVAIFCNRNNKEDVASVSTQTSANKRNTQTDNIQKADRGAQTEDIQEADRGTQTDSIQEADRDTQTDNIQMNVIDVDTQKNFAERGIQTGNTRIGAVNMSTQTADVIQQNAGVISNMAIPPQAIHQTNGKNNSNERNVVGANSSNPAAPSNIPPPPPLPANGKLPPLRAILQTGNQNDGILQSPQVNDNKVPNAPHAGAQNFADELKNVLQMRRNPVKASSNMVHIPSNASSILPPLSELPPPPIQVSEEDIKGRGVHQVGAQQDVKSAPQKAVSVQNPMYEALQRLKIANYGTEDSMSSGQLTGILNTQAADVIQKDAGVSSNMAPPPPPLSPLLPLLVKAQPIRASNKNSGDNRNALFVQIRNGIQLKPVAKASNVRREDGAQQGTGNIADVLRNQVNNKFTDSFVAQVQAGQSRKTNDSQCSTEWTIP